MKPAKPPTARLKGLRPVCPKCSSADVKQADDYSGRVNLRCSRCHLVAPRKRFHQADDPIWCPPPLSGFGQILPVYPLDD